jgi:hypothetical protein
MTSAIRTEDLSKHFRRTVVLDGLNPPSRNSIEARAIE